MATNLKKTVKLKTDKATGKTKLIRTHRFDASKARKIAKARTKRAVPPAKAATVKPKKQTISFQYTDLTGRKPKTVKAKRAA